MVCGGLRSEFMKRLRVSQQTNSKKESFIVINLARAKLFLGEKEGVSQLNHLFRKR